MKYIIILTDGMADERYESLGDKTPLEVAHIPTINELAKKGEIGTVHTVPASMPPGSDIANLSLMGYDPEKYHTGRSPLEAISMGIDLKDTDVTFRCNLVTLSEEEDYEDKTMIDYSAGEITSKEAKELIQAIKEELDTEEFIFYNGISYRHALIWKEGKEDILLTPPHDILERKITEYLPADRYGSLFLEMMKKSWEILKNQPVNLKRKAEGKRPANSIWMWGMGKKPILPSFKAKYGLNGAVISAVDLIKGIGLATGMSSLDVDGATGNIHTNFAGKLNACIKALEEGKDFIYLHLEAPDECGHQGDLEGKIKSIEIIDQEIVSPLFQYLQEHNEEYKLLILPDHPTPVRLRTHTRNAVPFVLYNSTKKRYEESNRFTEDIALKGKEYATGQMLIDEFLDKDKGLR